MKKRVGQIQAWMEHYKLPASVVFISTGVISTLWFLIRVIPKPSRAS